MMRFRSSRKRRFKQTTWKGQSGSAASLLTSTPIARFDR